MREPKDDRLVEAIPIVPFQDIIVNIRAQAKCFYGCSCYGVNGGCPPLSLTRGAFSELASTYQSGLLFIWKGADPKSQKDFQEFLLKQERFFFLERSKLYAISFHSGPCRGCNIEDPKKCPMALKGYQYCKAPKNRRSSLEACGVDVWATLNELKKNILKILKSKSEADKAYSIGLLLID